MANRGMPLYSAGILTAVALLVAGPARAAYFHEAHRSDALDLSDFALKARFIVTGVPRALPLQGTEALDILATPDTAGLFEQWGGIRIPDRRCGADSPKARPCELKWEAAHLAASKGAATRKAALLTLKSASGQTLLLRDWKTCAPQHECDGERFTYLGRLGRSAYLATEIGYGHDSPSLVLFHAQTGKILSVHYGSEPTFLSSNGTLLVSSEDLNDATSLLVTDLAGSAPAIDLQCLGARTENKSFGVTFKRWIGDTAFDVVLSENLTGADTSRKLPVRFERSPDGAWMVLSSIDLKAAGIECRARRPTSVK